MIDNDQKNRNKAACILPLHLDSAVLEAERAEIAEKTTTYSDLLAKISKFRTLVVQRKRSKTGFTGFTGLDKGSRRGWDVSCHCLFLFRKVFSRGDAKSQRKSLFMVSGCPEGT